MIDCRRCKRVLPETEFKPDQRYKRGFASWCAECHRQNNKEWYQQNREAQNAKAVLWGKDNLEKRREVSRRYHRANAEERSKKFAEWAKANRDKRNNSVAKRRAAKMQATPLWVNWDKVRAIYREARRIQAETGVKMHVDHIIPLQGETVCGLHWEGNLQVLPASANIAKHNKLIPETRQPPKQEQLL